eukprot:m.293367 g.293367  ORF g.293367 m.293367 type:complete len:57 (-) comp55120_c0_seq43:418-588(-)
MSLTPTAYIPAPTDWVHAADERLHQYLLAQHAPTGVGPSTTRDVPLSGCAMLMRMD